MNSERSAELKSVNAKLRPLPARAKLRPRIILPGGSRDLLALHGGQKFELASQREVGMANTAKDIRDAWHTLLVSPLPVLFGKSAAFFSVQHQDSKES
ncbi:hypothetical protein GCM10010987_78810 [Bradyrhizobium guangdongense]|uniref:Uncharacterized protein n=1 Tax=Bradyrhizobium guangdongense TaxID=1325090 RepID=A0AA87WH03_9BRAD|nr:hypothetical protein GCM10010987_78810 [Bradyrhizobium guangdongense]